MTNTLEGREGFQGEHGPPDSAEGGGEVPPGIKRIGVGEAETTLTSLPKISFQEQGAPAWAEPAAESLLAHLLLSLFRKATSSGLSSLRSREYLRASEDSRSLQACACSRGRLHTLS